MINVVEYKEKKNFNIGKKLEKKTFSLQFLPEILNDESKIKNIEVDSKRLKTSYLIDIVHNLLLKYYFKKENHFNLSSVILKEKYGHLYNYYINYLQEKGVIKLIKKHLKGRNARIYKLDESVLSSKIGRYKNSDFILLKKYKNAVSSIETSDRENSSIDPDVKKKLVDDLFHIEINYISAISFLDKSKLDFDIYNRNKYSVECIDDKHIFYHFDDYGRMHTNFTILKSHIRQNCLIIDGEETTEIDIPNSQPLFLCKLIEKERDLKVLLSNEYQLFKHLTLNGLFYQHIIDNSETKDKKLVKNAIYKVLFGKNFKNKHDQVFQNLFPLIYNFIKEYKKKYQNYKILSHHLQNLESNLIFNKIVKQLMYIYPEIKIVTVHDSIICGKKYKPIVKEIFQQNLENEFKNNLIL